MNETVQSAADCWTTPYGPQLQNALPVQMVCAHPQHAHMQFVCVLRILQMLESTLVMCELTVHGM